MMLGKWMRVRVDRGAASGDMVVRRISDLAWQVTVSELVEPCRSRSLHPEAFAFAVALPVIEWDGAEADVWCSATVWTEIEYHQPVTGQYSGRPITGLVDRGERDRFAVSATGRWYRIPSAATESWQLGERTARAYSTTFNRPNTPPAIRNALIGIERV